MRDKFVLTVGLLLALALEGCSPLPPPPSVTPAVDCYGDSPVIRLDSGWRFRTDPRDEGLSAGWHEPGFDDTDWRPLAPGVPWEFSGLDYDGVAWYRGQVVLPDWSVVYLGFGAVDDQATLWIDGEHAGSWAGADTHSVALPLSAFGEPGEEVQLALRVEDHGGYGGIKQSLRLGPDRRTVMTELQYVARLANGNPDWPMPSWVRNRPFAWTMTGGLGASDEALVSSDGAIAPHADSPIVEAWLYNPASGQIVSGAQVGAQFSLVEDSLPIPQWSWEAEGVVVSNVAFQDSRDGALRWRVTAQNDSDISRELLLLVAVRPLALNEAIAPIYAIGTQGRRRLWVNGDPFMIASRQPEKTGVGSLDQTMEAVQRGSVPESTVLECNPDGKGSGALVYSLRIGAGDSTSFHFAFPPAGGATFPRARVDGEKRLVETVGMWRRATDQVTLSLPDDHIADARRASIGYLLLALDPKAPRPGPLAHDSFWIRDAAYIGLALLQNGHSDAVKAYIPEVFDAQEADGRIPPIRGDDIPWDVDEWDAQGQAIFLVSSYYRYTDDLDTLNTWYPALRKSAQFIAALRDSEPDTEGPARGLLPPSKSAEDLGRVERHYYWDDFWAVVGLEEAAFAARELGETEDAAWMMAEADALRDAIVDSVESVMGAEPPYIPGAVEEVESSAMARGTVPVLWPVRVLSPANPLLERSFDHYYQRWIAPDQGGFRHRQGQFWPYGGLELAHAYLRLGREDVLHEILGWALENQTLAGTFAWAEQVNPETGGFSGGDMPHAWAAASYATLVREMLISENDGALELFMGVPDWWLEAEESITLENAPTHFGALNLRTKSTVRRSDSGWDGVLTLEVSGAEPPEGFRWQLPEVPVQVDGPPGTRMDGHQLSIPTTGGAIQLLFAAD